MKRPPGFECLVHLDGKLVTTARGRSKKRAEENACEKAFSKLQIALSGSIGPWVEECTSAQHKVGLVCALDPHVLAYRLNQTSIFSSNESGSVKTTVCSYLRRTTLLPFLKDFANKPGSTLTFFIITVSKPFHSTQ